MTSEIAIMNRQAVALAADSAVTVNYPDGQKIYNSVNKLFMLSKYAPVGIMVYGVADLTGVPWETIIKCFRRELGDTRLPHLQDYADRLIEYINGHKVMFSEESQARQFLISIFSEFNDILREIDRTIKEAIAREGPIQKTRVRSIATSVIRDRHSTWAEADRLPGTPSNYEESIRAKWGKQINEVIDVIFEKLPVSATSRKRLVEIALSLFAKDLFPDDVSGVVVAGFGEDDYMPGLVAYNMEGVLLNVVKVQKNETRTTTVTRINPAAIIPFAQSEMVHLFMEGIEPQLLTHLRHALDEFIAGLTDELVSAAKTSSRRESQLRGQINKCSVGLIDKFCANLASYRNHYHVQPVVSAVANLPKEELAAMAESLVSLTSFKRRVTHDPETVGGPIDVAVISKGDGFIWINRKHYFDPALNHHFFENYYRT